MIDNKITAFMEAQTCATICCIDAAGMPWCFSCYFEWNDTEGLLYFKSSVDSRHASMLKENKAVAGTVLPDKLNKLLVQGVQFEGQVLDASSEQAKGAAAFYHKKNPLALAIAGETWTVQINYLKMTDSTLGFGKKTVWERQK